MPVAIVGDVITTLLDKDESDFRTLLTAEIVELIKLAPKSTSRLSLVLKALADGTADTEAAGLDAVGLMEMLAASSDSWFRVESAERSLICGPGLLGKFEAVVCGIMAALFGKEVATFAEIRTVGSLSRILKGEGLVAIGRLGIAGTEEIV